MKPKIHKDCIIYFHLPHNWAELISEDINYKVFGESNTERIENMIRNFEEGNILIEGFYKVIPITKKRVDYKPSLI